MALYGPALCLNGGTFERLVLNKWVFNFCVHGTPLQGESEEEDNDDDDDDDDDDDEEEEEKGLGRMYPHEPFINMFRIRSYFRPVLLEVLSFTVMVIRQPIRP